MNSKHFPGLEWLASDPQNDSASRADSRAMWDAWDAEASLMEPSVMVLAEGKKVAADAHSDRDDLARPHPKPRRIVLKNFSAETIETVDEDRNPERFATLLALPTTVSIVEIEGQEVFRELVSNASPGAESFVR